MEKTRSEHETTKRKCAHFGFSARDQPQYQSVFGFSPYFRSLPKERKKGREKEGREKKKESERNGVENSNITSASSWGSKKPIEKMEKIRSQE